MAILDPTKNPNLPIAPSEYARQHFDVFNNVLRLYFNRIDGLFSNLFGTLGGKYIQSPHVSASGTENQFALANNTATVVIFDTVEEIAGFILNLSGSATAEQSGVYKIDYSLQFVNTDNAAHDAFVWLDINGSALVGSSSRFTIPARKNTTQPGYTTAYSSIEFKISAADEITLYWATERAYNFAGGINGVFMEHIAAITTPYIRPSNPSAVGSITFVSRNGT